MIGAMGVTNLSMVAYHRVMSSGLGEAYAELYAMTQMVNVLGVFSAGVFTMLVKLFAEDQALAGGHAAKARLLGLLRPLGIVMAISALVLALAAPLALRYLRLTSALPYALASGIFVVGLGLLLARAAVQGCHKFGALGLSLSMEGLSRVGAAGFLVSFGLGVAGALVGSLIAQAVGLACCLPAIARLGVPSKPAAGEDKGGWKEAALDAMILGLFSMLCFLDVMVLKHRLDPAAAALYSRASLVSKSFLYLAGALNLVLLPAISAARASGQPASAPRALWKFMGLMLALDLAGLALVAWKTSFVIRLLCGPDPAFLELAGLVRIYSAAVIPLALLQMALFYLLALRDYRVLGLMGVGLAVYAFLISWVPAEPLNVVACLGGVALVLLAGALGLVLRPSSQ